MFTTKNIGIFTFYTNDEAHQVAMSSSSSGEHSLLQHYASLTLQITLTHADFEAHKLPMLSILIDHLLKGACHKFKILNDSLFQAELNKLQEQNNWINTLTSNDQPPKPHTVLHKKALDDILSQKNELSNFIKELKENNDNALKFQNGNQITVYFPKKYSSEQIYQLCSALDDHFKKNKISAKGSNDGIVAEVTPQLNFRFETSNQNRNKSELFTHPLFIAIKNRFDQKHFSTNQLSKKTNVLQLSLWHTANTLSSTITEVALKSEVALKKP